MYESLRSYCRYLLPVFTFLTISSKLIAQTETLPTGSFIINMGATNPNTVGNGLKPYGLIYDLMRNHNVPIKWVIGQGKVKDGVDFTYNGTSFRGGTFIIPAQFRTVAVDNRITYWSGLGVVGVTTSSPLTLDITTTLKTIPRWTLDAQNGSIAEGYLINAGITNTAFPNAYNWKAPQTLDCCDDFFVMPHADPTWASHSRLYSWNKDCLGSIWAACHAGSALANAINPANAAQQMNFLSTRTVATTPTPWPNNALKLWGTHAGGSVPYMMQLPSDPVAQFMGSTELAQLNGSEQIYIPKQSTDAGGATRWNPGAKIITYDPSQADVASPDPANGNVAAVIVYGRGFDDNTRGYVMYEAGHSHNKGTVGDVAAQRAFLNFSFFQVLPKAPQLNITGISSGLMIQTGSNINGLNVVATSPLAGVTFSYQWTSSCGGVFTNPTGTTTNFTAPTVAAPTVCLVVCKVTDNCNRVSYQSFPITVIPPPVPPTPQNDIKTIGSSCTPGVPVSINVLANDTDPQGATFSFTSLAQPGSPANAGTWSSTAAGIVTFTPDPNFSGTASNTYTVTNSFGGTASATITINVGATDAMGCLPNQIWGIANNQLLTVADVVANTGATAAMTNGNANDPRLDDYENIFTSSSNTIGDFVDLGISTANLIDIQLPYALNIGDTIIIRWGKRTNAGTSDLSMLQSATNVFSGTAINYTITGTGNLPTTTRYPVLANGMNYIRIRPGTGTTQQLYIDALEFEDWSCVSRQPRASNDAYVVLEDVPTIFSVLDNDNDPTGSGLKITEIVSAPTNGGKVSINNNGTISFVSGYDAAGISTFTYRVCNAEGYCNTASVNVSISPDGCGAGLYRPNPPGGAVTKIFQYQFAGTNAATANAVSTNFKDSYIDINSPTTNKGTNTKSEIGKIFASGTARRGIFYFNTAEIPSTAIVQSANLSILRVGGDATAQTVYLRALTRSFTESQVTWNIAATGTNWTTPGGDFGAVSSFVSVTPTNIRFNWDMSGLAQTWTTTPVNNLGLILRTDELLSKRIQFATKENTTAANRPMLSVTYVVSDPCISIPNRNPLANPDVATTNSKTPVTVAALTNDADPDPAQAVSLVSIGAVTNGSAIISGSNIIFTPTLGFNGIATVIYNIQDNGTGNLQDQSIIYITVTNAAPEAINDLPAGVNSGTAQVVNIGTNDSDPEGAVITYTIYRDAKNISSPTIISTLPSTLTYTPAPGFTGTDTVFYYIQEPTSGCSNGARDSAYVVFTVLNRVPAVINDAKTLLPCQAAKIPLITNDTDPEGNTLSVSTISALSNPAAGMLVNNNDGSATFTPAMGFTGIVTFTYTVIDNGITPQTSPPATVTLTVAAGVNNPPVAANDVADQSNMDELVYASVLDNDFDQDGNSLTIPVITVNPIHGTAVVLMNGLIEYTPNPGFYGTDQLSYSICDIVLNPADCVATPTLCDPAIVSFTVVAPNSVLAGNDENSTWINTPVSGATLTNDYDPQGDYPISFLGFIIGGISYTGGTHTVSGFDAAGAPVANAGTVTINANGTYTYTPANNFTGNVTIPYAIKDANINAAYDTADLSITVNPLPGAANSVIANNDENKVFGGAVVSSTLFSNDRDPQGNLFTVTSFLYDSNGDGTADATGVIGASVTIGGATTSGKQIANAGTITINANGTYTYTPAPDFHGAVNMPYTICDNFVPPACATAILHIDVMIDANGPSNDPPQPGDDFAYTNINTPVNSNFIINDSDPNNNPVSLNGVTINTGGAATPIGSPVTTAKGGTVQFYANGTFRYTPPQGYVGPDSLGYQICDVTAVAPQPLCNTAFLHLLVGVNNTTDAINDENSTWQGVSVSGNVLTNDFDAESHIQSFGSFIRQDLLLDISSGVVVSGTDKTGATIANAGSLSFLANGNYTFIPEPSFTGTVSVPYRLCDNGNLSKCDTAYLVITVDPLPTTGINTVIANNDENRSYGSAVSGNLVGNDRDPQNDSFTVTAFSGGTVGVPGIVSGIDLNGLLVPNAGTLIINSNGTYTYTPSSGFVGSIDLPYTITDALGATSVARLHIDVLKDINGIANDPPVAGDDFGYTTVNKPVSGSFITNDSDPNADPVSYTGVTIVTGGPHTPIGSAVPTVQGGTIQFYTDGTYLYTPPVGYTGPDRVTYTICDVTVVTPQPLCATATVHLLIGPGVSISGKVWDDANGNVVINGAEVGTNAANTLYVNLADGSGNVVAVAAVAADGTYSFNNIDPAASYSLVLSLSSGTISQPAPAATLPPRWVHIGESRNGIIDGGTAGVIDNRAFGFTNTVNFDFGIEQLPESDDHTTNIPPPANNQFIVLNGGSNPPVLSGNDPEDCGGGCNMNGKTVVIDAIPVNAELYYNGILVVNGQQINNFNANLLQVKITLVTLGYYSTSFQYSYVDAATKKDPSPATYTLSWLSVVPVKLSAFTAHANKCDVVLQWTTTAEVNAAKFIIEQSADGIRFTAITQVNATNNSSGSSYRTVVSQQASQMYYRLKITDKDGRSGYSGIIAAGSNCGSNDYFSVYPNPVRADLTVSFFTSFSGKADLVLVNSIGQEMDRRKMNLVGGANTLTLDLNNYVPGIYLIYLADGSGKRISEMKKLIKE